MNPAKLALGALLALEGISALQRFDARKTAFGQAALRAKALGRKLIVVGNPDTGLHTRLLRAYGCGDVCIDLVGCGTCPTSITADITRGPVAGVPDNSAVVFVSCVLEYVSDPFSAWKEIVRMAGTPDNVFMVSVQPGTITSVLYPGAHWAIAGEPPTAPALEAVPVSAGEKIVYGAGLASLSYFAFRRPRARLALP